MQRKENTVMVKQEWKSLWRNKILMIVILVFLPSLHPLQFTPRFLVQWDHTATDELSLDHLGKP